MAKPVLLGRISGFFGVKGWVKLYSYTEPREAVLDYENWVLERDGQWQTVKPVEGQRHGKTVIVKLEGIDDRDAAAPLLGCEFGVMREHMPEPDEGTYYFSDLEGLEVVHRDGTSLGSVARVMETGANDVLVVQGDGTERLIPFVTGHVVEVVDLDEGVIRVDWEWD